MWKWEQGRLEYFQFDELRKIAKFGVEYDLRQALRQSLQDAVGLPFLPARDDYLPWRNYGRVFRIAMLTTRLGNNRSELTAVGKLLAQDGKVTTDEYFHFLARATTDPSPALSTWDNDAVLRYPLLFVLRFLLARATQGEMTTSIKDIVGAYKTSGFAGGEEDTEYLKILLNSMAGSRVADDRQPRESIKVLAQISYLTATRDTITVSLAKEDAQNLFADLTPIGGPSERSGDLEIVRRANLFPSATAEMNFEYPESVLNNVNEAGFDVFSEGTRVRRSHLTIERNQMIRRRFFEVNPRTDCDFCGVDTQKIYPWTDELLEIHHLLPLCSGARTSEEGTLIEDLVAVCPSCHRAVHRYYDRWLTERDRLDFADTDEARGVYEAAKQMLGTAN